MPQLIVELNLSPDRLVAYYRGASRSIVARATTGQTIQFPANVLHKLVLPDGVRGRFRLEFDENNKFVSMERISGLPE